MDTSYLPGLLGWAVLLPLFGFFIVLLFGPRLQRLAAGVSIAMIGLAGVLAFWCLLVIWLPAHWPAAAHHGTHGDHGPQAAADEQSGGDAQHGEEADADHADGSHADGSHADGSHASEAGHAAKPYYAGDYYTLGRFGQLQLTIGYYIDSLTLCMFCMVTLIATCIHIYAVGYMHEELEDVTDHEVTLSDGSHLTRRGRFARFFQYLSLFCFSMLGLVLAGNLLMVFVFWELVGICSYFLIGFYIERKSASNAANKAFIVNRVGDFGMIIGLLAIWSSLGTFALGDSSRQLFETQETVQAELAEGRVPEGLAAQLAEHAGRLSDFVQVNQNDAGEFVISEVGGNRSYVVDPQEGGPSTVWERRQGIFSLVRPPASPHNGHEPAGGPHQLVVPDRMVLEAVQMETQGVSMVDQAVQGADDVAAQQGGAAERLAGRLPKWREQGFGYGLLIIGGLGIFCGCVGKSAQFPLHVWLPDAMEGPTPVSALVHSATMVAAGVYLVGRFFPVFVPQVLLVIAVIGTITLFMAATIAITATDIKRVLAYSTVSQLGYMMMALGVGGWVAGLMHLITHAFFKSLLFLCSGSVIHAVHSNEMPQMGGLLKKMPITAVLMLIGCLAIIGASIPLVVGLSGYYSKDAILEQALSLGVVNAATKGWAPLFFGIAAGGAAITAFYMFRMWFLTFLGQPRDEHRYDHAHESPPVMWVPLFVLAVFAISVAWSPTEGVIGSILCLGIFGLLLLRHRASASERAAGQAGGDTQHADAHEADHDHDHGPSPVTRALVAATLVSGLLLLLSLIWSSTSLRDVVLANLLEQARPAGSAPVDASGQTLPLFDSSALALVWPNEHDSHAPAIKVPATWVAFLGGLAGVGLAASLYWFRVIDPADVSAQFRPVYRFLLNKWWFDELYDWIFVRPVFVISRLAANFDKYVIDRLIDWLAWLTRTFATVWDRVADQTLVDGFVDLFAGWTYSVAVALRQVQRGKLREYVMFIVLGTIVLFVLISFF